MSSWYMARILTTIFVFIFQNFETDLKLYKIITLINSILSLRSEHYVFLYKAFFGKFKKLPRLQKSLSIRHFWRTLINLAKWVLNLRTLAVFLPEMSIKLHHCIDELNLTKFSESIKSLLKSLIDGRFLHPGEHGAKLQYRSEQIEVLTT